MKKVNLTENIHSSSNEGIVNFLKMWEQFGVQIRFKLADRLEERNLTVRKCAELTGLRLGTISDLMNGSKTSVSYQHIWVLMLVLGISDISEIIEFHLSPEAKDYLDMKKLVWVKEQKIPNSVLHSKEVIQGNSDELLDLKEYMNMLQEER